jgi:hypothetical protein
MLFPTSHGINEATPDVRAEAIVFDARRLVLRKDPLEGEGTG